MPARAALPALRNVFATLFIPDATPGTGPWFDDLLPVSTDGETVARILTTSWHRRSRVGSPGESTQPLSPTHSTTSVFHSRKGDCAGVLYLTRGSFRSRHATLPSCPKGGEQRWPCLLHY